MFRNVPNLKYKIQIIFSRSTTKRKYEESEPIINKVVKQLRRFVG